MTCEDLGPYRSPGRPVSVICKRGHQHPRKAKCIICHRMMDRQRYDRNKEDKKAYMQQWRADFKLAFNIPYGTIYNKGLRKGDLS